MMTSASISTRALTAVTTVERRVNRYVAATVVLALAATLGTLWLEAHPLHPGWVVLVAVATAVTEHRMARRRYGRHGWSWSPTEALLALALILGPSTILVLAMAAGVSVQFMRLPAIKAGFNLAQMAVATSAAVTATVLLGGGDGNSVLPALAGMAVHFVCNNALVAGVVSRATGTAWIDVVREAIGPLLAGWVAATALGLLGGRLADEPLLLGLLALPLATSHAAYVAQVHRAEREKALRVLYEEVVSSEASEEGAVQAILTAVRRTFELPTATLVTESPRGRTVWHEAEGGLAVELADTDPQTDAGDLRAGLPTLDNGQTGWLIAPSPGTYARYSRNDQEILHTFALQSATLLSRGREAEAKAAALTALRELSADHTELRAVLADLAQQLAMLERTSEIAVDQPAAAIGLNQRIRNVRVRAEQAILDVAAALGRPAERQRSHEIPAELLAELRAL